MHVGCKREQRQEKSTLGQITTRLDGQMPHEDVDQADPRSVTELCLHILRFIVSGVHMLQTIPGTAIAQLQEANFPAIRHEGL